MHIWHGLRDHATHWVVGGVLLATTGFAPEEWLARAIQDLRLPAESLHLWSAGLDPRLLAVVAGVACIGFGLLRQQQKSAPVPALLTPPVQQNGQDSSDLTHPTLPGKPSVAVLPFTNLSGDPDQEYFSDGMVEDIITALSRLSWLFVIARNSSFTYKGRAVDVKQVGRELGVRYVLEGSVRKAAGRVRITGQLIDAATSAHLWADHFDGGLEDVFELQDRVASSVAGMIEPQLQRAEIERASRKPTQSLDAYDLFLRGMASFHRMTEESNEIALDLYTQSFQRDPEYGAALGMAAWCICSRKANGWITDYTRETTQAMQWARRAAEVGREDTTALWSAGHTLAYIGGELEWGAAMIERACQLNPNLAPAWIVAGYVQVYLGEPDAAIACFERALRLSPRDPFLYLMQAGIAHAHLLADRYEDAIAWADRAKREKPTWGSSVRVLVIAHALSGRIVEAQRDLAEALRLHSGLRVSNASTLPYRRSSDVERYLRGLRLAGLPE